MKFSASYNFNPVTGQSAMSHQTVVDIIERSMSDLTFAHRFKSDPESVLQEYDDLTTEETEALKSGNQNKLNQIVEKRANGIQIAGIVLPSSEA